MAGRGKSKELLQRLNELDIISDLPDPLICQILYHLPTKYAVRTSVLSTRWRTLWLWVPRLDLDYQDFQALDALVNFGDRYFDSDRVSCIEKVELNVDINHEGGDDPSYVTSWIAATVKRKIQHLDVRCGPKSYNSYTLTNYYFHRMPLSLYICETLVSLKLLEVLLPDSEFISLPCLKTLHLLGMLNPNEATFERLFSSCPVLEELDIYGCLIHNVNFLRVLSKSLKKLSIQGHFSGSSLVIDAPRLGVLSIKANLFERFTITNMDTNIKLVIDPMLSFWHFDEATFYSNIDRFCSFLPSISKVRYMMLSGDTFKGYSYSKWLPTILKSCPNLKSLSLVERNADFLQKQHLQYMDKIDFSYVPECLLSSLEFVDFSVTLSRLVGEMNLARYILENSAILKKLTLRLHNDCSTKKDDLVKKLLKIPRGSAKCEVVFDWNREQVRFCDDFA